MKHSAMSTHIDGHVHIRRVRHAAHVSAILDATHAAQAGIACQYEDLVTNTNPAGMVLKARQPERFFMLAGIEHSCLLFKAQDSLALSQQPACLQDLGADGIKLLASKPTQRRRLGQPVDGPYFRGFFQACEQLGMPLLWHTADPEEFWEPARLPAWAQEQGWGYDADFPTKQDLYRETEGVLHRHPGLQVVLPHFYFLSADLARVADFLNRHPGALLDLAPGIELFHNLSRNRDKTRAFFIQYADRFLFGTDILSDHSLSQARHRAELVYGFLAGNESFRVPTGADFLLGSPQDGLMQGLDLPQESLDLILNGNFQRIFNPKPRPLNRKKAAQECRRLSRIEAEVRGCRIQETEGQQALDLLEGSTI